MGGLGPGIGGMEYLVIALVALLVVGPERLPAMLNTLGKWVAKARNMANQFRASFDEMARQSELDELRKEVEALRRDQMVPLGAQATETFRSIETELNKPVNTSAPTQEAAVEAAADAKPESVVASKPKRTRKAAAPLVEGGETKLRAPRKKAVDL